MKQESIEKLIYMLAKTDHTIRMYEEFDSVGTVLVNDAGGILNCTDEIVELLQDVGQESPEIKEMIQKLDQQAKKDVLGHEDED